MKIFNFKFPTFSFRKGFTLSEILIAISVVIILATISISAFTTLQPDIKLSGIARELITDFRYAQQLTVTEQVNHGIHFFSLENKYQLIRYGATEEVIKEILIPGGISFQQITGFTEDTVKFNPYGSVIESGSITLVNTNNKTKTIEVRPSGFVKISD
jgi:prepilin-type N-terminal cleavage/methylation domain-containing protein